MFVRTKRGADRLVKQLASSSVQAVAMHGDKSQGQRERALANFEAGVVDTLVATDVAARGIDVAGITHVINYDIPATREDYVHRIGRTARAGASGVGVTLVAPRPVARTGRHGRRPGPASRARSWRACRARHRRPASGTRQAGAVIRRPHGPGPLRRASTAGPAQASGDRRGGSSGGHAHGRGRRVAAARARPGG